MSARVVIVVGDHTDHGGTVLSGAARSSIRGRATACVGDTVSCPLHGDNAIVQGSTSCRIDGRSVALEGHKTACGSCLIGSGGASVLE